MGLSGGLDGAFFCQVTGFATVVAVDFTRLTALHSNVANLTTPVALDFFTAFLNVSKSSTRVALLLIGVVTVASHMAGLATVVTHLLPLLFGLLAVSGDVASPATVVAGIFSSFTVSSNMARLSTAVTEKIFSSSTTFATSPSSIWTVLDPVASAAATKALVAAHLLNL